jgi:hypothetical protein
MRIRSTVSMIAVIALFGTQTGCGTLVNLWSPPENDGIGPSTCFPFGGVTRSALLAGVGTFGGPFGIVEGEVMLASGDTANGFQTVGLGLGLTGAGIVSIVDALLSFAGDIVTSPIAYARWQKAPWATWWGPPGLGPIMPREAVPADYDDEYAIEIALTDPPATDSPQPARVVYP